MVELSLRERLQPSLIDRLIDEERLLTIYELTFEREELRRLGFQERDLVAVIAAQGLSPALPGGSAAVPGGAAETLRLRFSAPYARVGVSQLNALILEPPGAQEGVALERLCNITTHNVPNDTAESADQRFAAARRLREYVSRDLSILLNAASLEATVDLSAVPHVQRSVLNYGMPSPTGKAVSSVSLARMAKVIETAIRQFEPRLTKVRVAPEAGVESREMHQISFRIDAELWGQPAPHQIVLRTRIDTESGDVRVNDSGGR
jgi:type VI secretion system protein ImpF